MNKFIIFIVFILFSFSCQNSCYSERYQIHDKEDIGDGMCEYVAWGIGYRYTWTDLSVFVFKDSCNVYDLSRIIPRTELEQNYGFDCRK